MNRQGANNYRRRPTTLGISGRVSLAISAVENYLDDKLVKILFKKIQKHVK